MKCIICDNPIDQESSEHIIPESLGNKEYVLDIVFICKICNNKFSKFEEKAMYKTMLGYERARIGVYTKKNKPSKGLVNGMEWTANDKGKKNFVTAKGVNPEFIDQLKGNSFNIRIPIYDKNTNVATSKLILKIGIESIINSLPNVADKYNLSKAKSFLKGENNYNWPYAIPKTYASSRFKDFLNENLESHLHTFNCRLSYREINNDLLFRFKYASFTSLICLNSDSTGWINVLKGENKSKFTICPDFFRGLSNVQ